MIATLVAASPAYATDGEPYPEPVPSSPVPLDEGATGLMPEDPDPILEPGTGPAPNCTPSTRYSLYSNIANDMKVFDRWAVGNGTSRTISATFRADTGGSVAVSASISLSASVSAGLFAKVEGTVNAGVDKTMTASTGVSTTSSVKPHSTLKGDYGIWREAVKGKRVYKNGNCQNSTSYFNFYAPYRKGWRVFY